MIGQVLEITAVALALVFLLGAVIAVLAGIKIFFDILEEDDDE